MGAWGHQVLFNDCALDTIADFSEDATKVKQQLYNLMHGESYIDDMLLAAAIVDASINGLDVEIFGSFYDYEDWFESILKEPMTELKDDALRVVRFIQNNDHGWVESCVNDRKHLLKLIENRLAGKKMIEENQQNELRSQLREKIFSKMEEYGNKDVVVDYISLYYAEEPIYALADVSYTWSLNGYAKRIVHKSMIFVLKDNMWHSPIFH